VTLEKILGLLGQNGLYHFVYRILNAKFFNVPQHRERIFLVGIHKKYNYETFEFPTPNPHIKCLEEVLMNVPESKGYEYSEKKKKLFSKIPQGGCWINLSEKEQKEYLGKSYESGGGKRGILYRLSMKKPSLTLLCSPSQKQTERCHPIEDRPLRIREYARIQTFQDDYEFCGSISSQYKQIGNAVPVLLAYEVGKCLQKFLENQKKKNEEKKENNE
jgi:DNA (cytosine-5)-methyltransferase 1